ncbi:hypothetical protein OH76DRAFT_1480666 [Lentinus brumalis]|uniref:Ubiquitin-like protease family profile domain-containing protein n=1 Tax=Lentinus brumalis TaxID=2498619 RepID=A0A371DJ57_9APHY|nr:hypothetical protein OH76DRAFT_1480666 [Polyporus brumalis]
MFVPAGWFGDLRKGRDNMVASLEHLPRLSVTLCAPPPPMRRPALSSFQDTSPSPYHNLNASRWRLCRDEASEAEVAPVATLALAVEYPIERLEATGNSPSDAHQPTGRAALFLQLHEARNITHFEEVAAQKRLPDFLNTPKRDQTWSLVQSVHTHMLFKWFEEQKNDYLCNGFKRAGCVRLTWVGHPGDSPVDARARPFIAEWNSDTHIAAERIERAIRDGRPVVRWKYYCGGVHDYDVEDIARAKAELATEEDGVSVVPMKGGEDDEEDDEESDGESHSEEGAVGEGAEEEGQGAEGADKVGEVGEDSGVRSRWDKCGNKVRLRLEITADDLSKVKIWMKYAHHDATGAQLEGLQPSRYLRLLILERFRVTNARVSMVKKGLQAMLDGNKHDHAASRALKEEVPSIYRPPDYRMFQSAQITNMFKMNRNRERLDRNPIRAVHILARRETDRIYFYTPHNFQVAETLSEFTVAMTDPFSLDSLILNGLARGWALDSSWRNKNENRAAVTFLIAVSEAMHAMPGSVLMSANVRTHTLASYLRATKVKLLERAIAIDKGEVTPEGRTDTELASLREGARLMTDDDYVVCHFMIDKSLAELYAIREVYPGVRIRLCQFHVVQAITRLDCDSGERGAPMRITMELKVQIVYHFRRLQRCRKHDDWPRYVDEFFCNVERAIMAQVAPSDSVTAQSAPKKAAATSSARAPAQSSTPTPADAEKQSYDRARAQWVFIRAYFENNWFTEPWIETFTDIGLPDDGTRDGTWNTNNPMERSFRTFDTVFLENRKNKRADRLVCIVLNDYLPFYHTWRPEDRGPPASMLELDALAWTIWDKGFVRRNADGLTYTVDAPGTGNRRAQTFPRVTRVPPSCPCDYFQQTGKMCAHIKAIVHLETSGPVEEWQEVESLSEKRRLVGGTSRTVTRRMGTDVEHYRQLDRIMERIDELDTRARLQAEEEELHRDIPEPTGTFQSSTPGRPKNITAMQPYRTPTTKRIMDAKARATTSPSPSKVSSRNSKPVIFSKKRGVPKAQRLAHNSTFPRTQAIRNAYLVAVQMAQDSHPSRFSMTTHSASPVNRFVAPASLDGPMTSEEQRMGLFDFVRWKSPDYTFRADEWKFFMDFFNNSVVAQRKGIMFMSSPQAPLATFLEANYCVPHGRFTLTLRVGGYSSVADLIESRAGMIVTHLVFVHLENQHWTLHDHDLTGDDPTTTSWNSLSGHARIDLAEQLTIARMVHKHQPGRNTTVGHQANNTIDPTLLSASSEPSTLLDVPTGLQTDGSSCGFWTVLFAWGILVQFNPHDEAVYDLTVNDLKVMYELLWRTFKESATGLPMSLVQTVFEPFGARLDWQAMPPTFAHRDCMDDTIARLISSSRGQRHRHITSLPEPVVVPPVTERADLAMRLEQFVRAEPKGLWHIGHDKFRTEQLCELQKESMVSGYMIDIALALLLEDLRRGRWDVTFGRNPTASRTPLEKLLVNREWQSYELSAAAGIEKATQGLKPRGDTNLWYNDVNIFELDLLVVPYFWKSSDHWLCAVVDLRAKKISVYDSYFAIRRARRFYRRIFKMLQWEYRQRLGGDLAEAGWQEKAPEPFPNVPQQGNTVNCAIYTIRFVVEIICGRTPCEEGFSFTPEDAQRYRRALSLRVIEADPQRVPAETYTVTPGDGVEVISSVGRNVTGVAEKMSEMVNSESNPFVVPVRSSGNVTPSRTDTISGGEDGSFAATCHGLMDVDPIDSFRAGLRLTSPTSHMTTQTIASGQAANVETIVHAAPSLIVPEAVRVDPLVNPPEVLADTLDPKPSPNALSSMASVDTGTSAVEDVRPTCVEPDVNRTPSSLRIDPASSISAVLPRANASVAAAGPVTPAGGAGHTFASASWVERRKHAIYPQPGEWQMVVYKQAPVAPCPYRVFPAEVIRVDKDKGTVTVRPDASLLWLGCAHASAEWDSTVSNTITTRLSRARTMKLAEWQDMEMSAVAGFEIPPMIWPADLCHDARDRMFAVGWSERRTSLARHLKDQLPGMALTLHGATTGPPLFLATVHDALLANGYDDEGERIRDGTKEEGWYDFYARCTSHPERVEGAWRKLLDAADEAIVRHVAETWYKEQPAGDPSDHMRIKTVCAGGVYLTYAAVALRANIEINAVRPAIEAGRLLRPMSRYELAWEVYQKVRRILEDTHRWVHPGIEVESARILVPKGQ